MRRSRELTPLSHDHQHALAQALKLRRASADDLAAVVAGFLAFLVDEGRSHFAQEEALLVPAVPSDRAELAERMLAEHVDILARAEALGRAPELGAAHELGELMSRHVRFEERELFPTLEERLPADRLLALGHDLAHPW